MNKVRLDELLLINKKADNLRLARAYIAAGLVSISGQIFDKCGTKVKKNAPITLELRKFATRAGLKLEQALKDNNIDIKNKITLDIGAGQGGFSDCLLKHGATKVYAVDVGRSLIIEDLKKNPGLVYLPKTDFRFLDANLITEKTVDFFCIDVSFISSTSLLKKAANLLKKDGAAVVLIKPQFEAPKALIEPGGVITSEKIHASVINKVVSTAENYGLDLLNVSPAKIKGKKKNNQEFLAYFKKIN